MCGRYAILLPPEAMRQLYRFLGAVPNWPARYNVAPTQSVPIIHSGVRTGSDAPGGRVLAFVRWGLVPFWAKEIAAAPLINARGESVAEKPSFREAFQQRRCLVPADGFYEWLAVPGQKIKQPMFIRRRGAAPIAFGGLYERWKQSDGTVLDSMAIVTTSANATLKPIHDRMPVILDEAQWESWLDCTGGPAAARTLIRPCPDDWLEAYPVSTRVNSVAFDGPDLIERATPLAPQAPELRPATRLKKKDPGRQGSLF